MLIHWHIYVLFCLDETSQRFLCEVHIRALVNRFLESLGLRDPVAVSISDAWRTSHSLGNIGSGLAWLILNRVDGMGFFGYYRVHFVQVESVMVHREVL